MRQLALGLGVLAILTSLAQASRRCGDDVDGRGTAVRCDCGDVLTSSHTLTADDPITRHACAGSGLLVDVPSDRPAATLSLAGQTIAGSGRGIGIQVVSGGSEGLTLRGPGTIREFGTGVLAPNGALAAAVEVVVADNGGDGFSVAGIGYSLTGCEATRNGRDGFALRGQHFRIEGNRAIENRRLGFAVSGREGTIGGTVGNEASANGRGGLAVQGRGHDLARPVAMSNGGSGIRAQMAGGRISGALARGNRGHGLRVDGHDLTVADGDARDNGRAGVRLRGARLKEGPGLGRNGCDGAGCR